MNNEQSRTITELPAGCRGKVSKIEGASGMRARLSALGLVPGAEVEVIASSGDRHILKVRECSLVLDDETASQILCVPLTKKTEKRGAAFLRKLKNCTGKG